MHHHSSAVRTPVRPFYNNLSNYSSSFEQSPLNNMMIKDDSLINFSGLTHDHAIAGSYSGINKDDIESNCSIIAILRRHPMYDCLVLVKKFRNCISGHSLEFPNDKLDESGQAPSEEGNEIRRLATDRQKPRDEHEDILSRNCNGRRLVSTFLDGDDPMSQDSSQSDSFSSQPFPVQIDDQGNQCELVHVPINGLLDRLKNYTQSGIAVDSRVYAFAMGLKTAERILATNSMKELQETPI